MELVLQMCYYLFALLIALLLLKAYNRDTVISKKMALAMLMNFLIINFYSLNFTVYNLVLKSIGCSLAFICTDLMLFFYFDYIVSYIGWDKKIPRTVRISILAYIFLDSIFLLMNPFNELTLSYVSKPYGDNYLLSYVPKAPFHFHTVFDMGLIFAMIVFLVLKCFEVPKIFHKRYFGPIAGMAVVIIGHTIYLMGVIPIDIDPTPLMYVIVGFILYFFNFNYLPGIILGITRQMILQYLSDPIILFDYEGQLADYSPLMTKLMPQIEFGAGNLTLREFIEQAGFEGIANTDIDHEFDWTHTEQDRNKIYQCSFCVMRDETGKMTGKLFVFHDVTDARNTYFELENSTMFDAITGFYNKQSLYTQFPQWNNPEYWPVSFVVCNVDGMRALNEAYGDAYGDGVMREVSRYIRRRVGSEAFCAKSDNGDIVVVLEKTANADAGDMMEAIREEVLDFYEKMPVSIEYGIATKEDRSQSVEKVVQSARASMQNKKMLKEKSASSSLVDSLKQTLYESDFQTEAHVERTRVMAARLGRKMGLEDAEIGRLELIAILHDIGKVAIPQDIIKKQGKLTEEERSIIEQHTVKGYRIAKSSPELGEIADGILCHHEHWDGSGYPNGLKGEEIPLIARIISAVDSHDVMVNDRPYHKAMPELDAIAELRRCSGTQFDPYVVKVFTQMLEEEELPKEVEAAVDAIEDEDVSAEKSNVDEASEEENVTENETKPDVAAADAQAETQIGLHAPAAASKETEAAKEFGDEADAAPVPAAEELVRFESDEAESMEDDEAGVSVGQLHIAEYNSERKKEPKDDDLLAQTEYIRRALGLSSANEDSKEEGGFEQAGEANASADSLIELKTAVFQEDGEAGDGQEKSSGELKVSSLRMA